MSVVTLPPLIDPGTITGFDENDTALAVVHASAIARGYCGWHIAPTVDETLTLDGNGATVLPLPSLYVTAVSSVSFDDTALEVDSYEWSARGLLRRAAPGWEPCWRSIVVQLTHGYAQTPDDVAAVVHSLARQRLTNPDLVRQETIKSYSVTYSGVDSANSAAAALGTPANSMILDRYRVFNAP